MGTFGGPQIVSDGLIMHIDSANPHSYPGSGTAINDLSGNGNNGTLTNGPTFNSSNHGSIAFDGVDEFINAPIVKTTDCTFSCWAKTTVIDGSTMLFNAGPSGAGPDLYFNGNKIAWNIWNGTVNAFAKDGTPTPWPSTIRNGKYHNIVVTNDSNSTAKLYYDGVYMGETVYHTAANFTNLTIGGSSATYMWDGDISQFYVYNTALSATGISQNFNAHKSRYI